MQWTKALLIFLIIALLQENSRAQSSSAFPSLWYSRSIAAGALGEEGVVSRDAMDAMQYNPANLVRVNGLAVSIFGNPWKIVAGWIGRGLPITSMKGAISLGTSGTVGLEYTNWDMGEFSVMNPAAPEATESFYSYERSLAGGYALPIGEEVAVGAQMRYVWRSLWQGKSVDHLLFGAGVSYEPDIFSHRINMGLSLVNFGTAIEFPSLENPATEVEHGSAYRDSPPAQMHLGIRGSAVAHEYFDLDLAIGAMKPFTKYSDPPEFQGQSSFKSLFNDWDDFPDDVTGQIGLGFNWHPIPLGGGVTFVQEMYVGIFAAGATEGHDSFFTHGARVGLQARGVSLLAGYAGRWHNNRAGYFLPWSFPWESFQLDLSSDLSLFAKSAEMSVSTRVPRGIILSGGYTHGVAVGKMKENAISGGQGAFSYRTVNSFSNKTTWSMEADFYISEKAALLTALSYARMTQTVTFIWNDVVQHGQGMDFPIETVSLESGFRYHPIEEFRPFFVQASLGIIRMNPVGETAPRYVYQTFDRVVVGSVFPLSDWKIVLIPRIGLRTLLLPEFTNGERLGGNNQFEFGANIGYSF